MTAYPELAERIERHAREVAHASVAATYHDPFRGARFGPEGRRLAEEDAVHDVEALVRALRTGDHEHITKYARWLQVVLLTRGMTSLHIAESFHAIADAIRGAGIADSGPARTMLDRAVLALRHDGTTGAAVQDASRRMAEDAVVTLRGVHLGEEMEEAEWISAVEVLVSYLADAMALDRPDLLGDYVRWLAQFGVSSVRPAPPDAMLAALEGALDELPDDARRDAERHLTAGRGALEAPVR